MRKSQWRGHRSTNNTGSPFLPHWERLLPFITASPQIHISVLHLFSPLGPEELNYNFVPTSARSNLTLPEMRRCLGIKDQRLPDWGKGGGPEAGVDDAFPILSGPCGAGAQGWLGVVRRRGRSLGGEVRMMKGGWGKCPSQRHSSRLLSSVCSTPTVCLVSPGAGRAPGRWCWPRSEDRPRPGRGGVVCSRRALQQKEGRYEIPEAGGSLVQSN